MNNPFDMDEWLLRALNPTRCPVHVRRNPACPVCVRVSNPFSPGPESRSKQAVRQVNATRLPTGRGEKKIAGGTHAPGKPRKVLRQ